MRIRLNPHKFTQASVLAVALMVAFVMGIGMAGYLTLVYTQNLSVARAQAWNSALAVAEGGIEEAMAHLNPGALLFTTNFDRAADGWTYSGGFYRIANRAIGSGSCDVAISADACPVVYSTGYVAAPFSSVPLARIIKVTTTNGSVFGMAMASKMQIDFKGFRVMTDSFNSKDPMYSTAGLYDVTKRRDNGDVASTLGIINVGSAKIMGNLKTGPDGSYNMTGGGSVGDLSWVLGGTSGIQQGHYRNDFNMDFPDVLPPYTTGVAPASKTVLGTNYFWVLGSNNYLQSDDVKVQTGDTIVVAGRARVYVTGDFIMQGSSKILIVPGASLELYVGGANTAITTVNNGGNCATFQYYGLPANTSFTLSGNDAFLGTIYAPNANFSMGGGGSTDIDFQGACKVNSINMNGHFKFHFDENLKLRGPASGFVITSWAEL